VSGAFCLSIGRHSMTAKFVKSVVVQQKMHFGNLGEILRFAVFVDLFALFAAAESNVMIVI
jgi:hypothetical protein